MIICKYSFAAGGGQHGGMEELGQMLEGNDSIVSIYTGAGDDDRGAALVDERDGFDNFS